MLLQHLLKYTSGTLSTLITQILFNKHTRNLFETSLTRFKADISSNSGNLLPVVVDQRV